MWANFSQILLLLAGIFLIIVVLLQRGRGGGLAGAFGGLGGQSAFGTKAGDVFTRITIVIAIIWVALAGGSGFLLRASSQRLGSGFQNNAANTEEGAGAGAAENAQPAVPEAPEIEQQPGAGAGAETGTQSGNTEAGSTGTTENGSTGSPAPEPSTATPPEE